MDCDSLIDGESQDFITKWTFSDPTTQISFNTLTTDTVHYTWEASPSGNNGNGNFIQTTPDQVTLIGLNIMPGDTITLIMMSDYLSRFYFESGQGQESLIDVSQWGDVAWTSMHKTFNGASNLILSATDSPDLSNATDRSRMFSGAISFNQNIGDWDVSNVTNMALTFSAANSFNQDIGDWDVSNVNDMRGMFRGADSFNQDIGGWDVSNVTNMRAMFGWTSSFNQNIGDWDVSNVNTMFGMFHHAEKFNQDIGDWKLPSIVIMGDMLDYSGIDCDHYSATLVGWQKNNPSVNRIRLGAAGLQYGTSAVTARDFLINVQGWTIYRDEASGMACDEWVSTNFATKGHQLTIYPNPTSDQVTIKGDQFELEDIRVINTMGQDVTAQVVVQQQSPTSITVELAALDAGEYFLKTSKESGIICKQ